MTTPSSDDLRWGTSEDRAHIPKPYSMGLLGPKAS